MLTESRGSVQGADSKNHYFNFIVLLYNLYKLNPCYIAVAITCNQHFDFFDAKDLRIFKIFCGLGP